MKIYLTRHSQTLWNQEKRLQGHQDSPLTQEGEENALALKKYLHNYHFDAIYTSPILRALKTAQIICPHQDITIEPLIMEMNFGEYEGRLISEISKDSLYDQLWNDPENFTRIPGGESYKEVITRAQQFIEKIKKHNQNDCIFVITHGMFFNVLIATLLGDDLKDLKKWHQRVVKGCSLTCIDYTDGKMHLEYFNQYAYLPHVPNEEYKK